MRDFALTYGALMITLFSFFVSCTTLFIAWQALHQWKKRTRVEFANKTFRLVNKVYYEIQHLGINLQDTNSNEASLMFTEKEKTINELREHKLYIKNIFPEICTDIDKIDAYFEALHTSCENIKDCESPYNISFIAAINIDAINANIEETIETERKFLADNKSHARRQFDQAYKNIEAYLTQIIKRGLK